MVILEYIKKLKNLAISKKGGTNFHDRIFYNRSIITKNFNKELILNQITEMFVNVMK